MKLDIIIIAAVAESGVIGRGNALPWRLKSDMAHFRELTMGSAARPINRSASRSRVAPRSS
jgi:dihydrofolate reductase